MTGPHLPDGVRPEPRGVVAINRELGTAGGHRLVLLSLERWDGWADLRFARVDVDGTHRLTRRIPPADAWRVRADGVVIEIVDAVGRGDRSFSNGEVRLVPPPTDDARLDVEVTLVPGEPPLRGSVQLEGVTGGHLQRFDDPNGDDDPTDEEE